MRLNEQIKSILPDDFRVIITKEHFGLPESKMNFHKHVTVKIVSNNGDVVFYSNDDYFNLPLAGLEKLLALIDDGSLNTLFVDSYRIWGTLGIESDPIVPYFQGPTIYTFLFDPFVYTSEKD